MNIDINNINELTRKTYRWINLNELNLGEVKVENKEYNFNSLNDSKNEGVRVYKNFDELDNEIKLAIKQKDENQVVKENKFGASDKLVENVESNYNNFISIVVSKTNKEEKLDDKKDNRKININYFMDDNNPNLINNIIVYANKNSNIELVINYRGERIAKKEFHNGLIKIYAEADSRVKVTQIQDLSTDTMYFNSIVSFVEKRAKVKYISVDVGSNIIVSNYVSYLLGDDSHSDLKSIYLGYENSKLDYSYSMIHSAISSKSSIVTKGVLMNDATKVFKGNIDFKKGAVKSKGKESEHVILLSPNAVAKSVPLLLCAEEDVSGEHSASTSMISEDKLFYLKSRGFSEKQAIKLIIESEFKDILEEIDDELLTSNIIEKVEGRLSNA